MDFVKQVGVSQERAETGFGAEINRPSFIFDAREVGRIGITENAPA